MTWPRIKPRSPKSLGYPTGQYIVHCPLQYKINNVLKELLSGIDRSLYDNLMIYFKSKYIHTIEKKLQQGLKKINWWATVNGFSFSKTKTKCVLFFFFFFFFCYKKNYIMTPTWNLMVQRSQLETNTNFRGWYLTKS